MNAERPVWTRRKAHSSSVLSVAWDPLRDAVLATGSTDRTVKVWSTEGDPEECDTVSSSNVEPYTIFAGHEVWRLHWCSDSDRTPLLATVNNSPQLDNLGRVFVWDLVNPHLPVCTLDGHVQDLCVDFAWLNSSNNNDMRGTFSGSTASRFGPPDRAGNNRITTSHTRITGMRSRAVQGVLSVGRDGRLLVQALTSGWRPCAHMSSSVMAVSSKGHVAYFRGAMDMDQVSVRDI